MPPITGTLGLALFLASLTMLFLAAIGAYIVIRVTGQLSPARGTIHLPSLLWGSTAVVLLSSVTMQHALSSVRQGKQKAFRRSLTATLGLAVLFVVFQVPALHGLLTQHQKLADQHVHIYGLVFCLVLLHAAHVLGGLIPMAVVWAKANAGHYSDVYFRPILHVAMYWHFLDAVWFVMFSIFVLMA
ncbi:MAG: cytochrome c oxidase subunit 3 [Planctomycetota bacterium]|nr:cytochrome c oxidase subunit 3 [Planctomycetota bacterium]